MELTLYCQYLETSLNPCPGGRLHFLLVHFPLAKIFIKFVIKNVFGTENLGLKNLKGICD